MGIDLTPNVTLSIPSVTLSLSKGAPRWFAVALLVLFSVGVLCGSAIAGTPSARDQGASSERIASAWNHLAQGEAKRAYREFARELPFWDTVQRQSQSYIDCKRGMMIAAIFMRDDARAKAMRRQIGGDSLEPAADRLVFAGRWNDAFRAYRDTTPDNAMIDPRPNAPDQIVSEGVDHALRGDFRGAIRAWSKPAVGGGPYDLTDKQTALVGLARARLGDWTGAESAWIAAARTTQLLPQMSELYDGNAMGLAMLMHCRRTSRAPIAHIGGRPRNRGGVWPQRRCPPVARS